jgi:hypothetical protein
MSKYEGHHVGAGQFDFESEEAAELARLNAELRAAREEAEKYRTIIESMCLIPKAPEQALIDRAQEFVTEFDELVAERGPRILENFTLKDEVKRLRAVLRAVEWNGCDIDAHGKHPTCPACGNFPGVGHATGCPIAAVLAGAGAAPGEAQAEEEPQP